MEIWNKQKKIWFCFCVFLAFMFACTLISRAVYASKLPQVSADTPRRMAISHKVEAEGIVHQGREYAVNALSGLRVRTVYAHVGDKITAETLLFEVDMEDLEAQVREKELAIKKLQLQIADQEKNRALQEEKGQIDTIRAQEDYERSAANAQQKIDRAEWEKKLAERDLKAFKDNPVRLTSEEERKAAQKRYEDWAKEAERLKTVMEEKKQAWEAAKDTASQDDAVKAAYDAARDAYEEYIKTPVIKPDYSAEDVAYSAWEKEKRALEDVANAAALAQKDAEAEKEKEMENAERNLDDAEAERTADSSLEINRLELAALWEELSAYRKVLQDNGQVYPEADGIVTKIQVNPGERTPDGAAVVYADLSSPMQFTVSLSKEQKKYVNQGDTAMLSFGSGRGEEYRVDYIAENEMNPAIYEARILLQEGVGMLGQSGTFEVAAQSETYSCCIPIAALHEDANRRKFVYIVSEKSGILGKELAAEAIYVKVLDQNDSYAAIEEGVLSGETELIVSSTEPIEDRTVIRYRE